MEETTIKLTNVNEIKETIKFLKPLIVTYSGFYSKRIIKVIIEKNKNRMLINYKFNEKNYYLKLLRELRKICS